MNSSNKKYFWNVVLIVTVTVIAMYFALRDNFGAIMHAISQMNFFSLLVILAWGLAINVVIGAGYTLLGKRYQKQYSLKDGITVAFVGTFFAGITPSSTGGQFGQAYVLKKQGIDMSDGISLLWADFIIYQTTMMLYVTLLFILRFTHYVNVSAWFWIVFVGYLINVVVILALYTIALFPKFYIKLAGWAVKFLGRLHILKDPERQKHTWVAQVTSFTAESKKLSTDKKMILQLVLLNFVRLTLYFALPFAVSLALGIKLKFVQLVDTLALSSFVTMANCFVPLPGATGGTEVFFTMLFQNMLGRLTGAVLLLWRFSSYYLPVLVGALVFLLFKNHEDSKEDGQKPKEPLPDVPKRSISASQSAQTGKIHSITPMVPLDDEVVHQLAGPESALPSKPHSNF
ncbi:lysylphosphatidylglycerol synthase transmembrane domain-containing protein [Erysipelotrichaceae bacterium 51-3]